MQQTSKKLPLWLVFENADRNGENITVMFKCGDDLRQDVLTLQMIKVNHPPKSTFHGISVANESLDAILRFFSFLS